MDKNFLMEHSDFCFVFKPIEHSGSISYTNLADNYFPGYKSCEMNEKLLVTALSAYIYECRDFVYLNVHWCFGKKSPDTDKEIRERKL